MSVSPNIQAIICEEIFDESSHPSVEEINEYAQKIGIDPTSEPHLLHLAKEGLMQALPSDWKPCYDELSKSYYYYNKQNGRTQWEHPLDDVYRSMVGKVRSSSQQASIDEDSKNLEDHTYTKEDLQSFEESLPKPLSLAPQSPVKTINLGARKKDVKLSPVKVKSTSMHDFGQKNDFLFDRNDFLKRKSMDKSDSYESKNFLLKKDKHPNSIEKGELKLSGGGSMFLKSNTKKLVTQISDSFLDVSEHTKSFELPKSILRDRSLPETYSLSSKEEQDDDKKSVRFNLEHAEQRQEEEINFDFSDSDQNQTSDEEIEIFAEPKLPTENPIKSSRFTVSPVAFDEYGPKKNESLFAKIENAEKLEEQASMKNCNLKLIKPNPTDFITPKLINKPLDVVKSIPLGSDSEDEMITRYKAKFPKEEALITEKIEVDDSIPEETTEKSFDISYEEKEAQLDLKTQPEETKKQQLEEESHANLLAYKAQLQATNNEEIEQFKQTLLTEKQHEIERLKQSIMDTQKTEYQEILTREKLKQEQQFKDELENVRLEMSQKYKDALAQEEKQFDLKLAERKAELERRYNETLEAIENTFKEKEKEIEHNFQMSLKQTETDFLLKLEERIKEISIAHKVVLDRMKDDHDLTLEELLRDFKSEEEIIRKEQQQHLVDIKDKVGQELEVERQRMRDLGEDRLYEKVRCEKRLLEDKYRCLKEKYLRLKTDVKISLDRRNRRKEQSLTTTTGSDTERSTSHKKGSNSERANVKSIDRQTNTPKHLPKSSRTSSNDANTNNNRSKPESKSIQQIIIEDLDTSMSDRSARQSKHENDNSKSNNDFDSSDGVANPGRSRRKLFTRLKSNSTSRLNNNSAKQKEMKRSCSPVENLRRQLQKLEDLEDQFPQTAPSDTYHLRYPFSDAGDIAGSSELEFFRHRIHLERDSVRRAKESLRTQRSNFQKRQRDLKLRHAPTARNTLQQLYQEERELSDMEVSLHRTRSLLGEKVIRLRHLEQSLQRLSMSNKQEDATLSDLSSHSASSGISSTEFATATDNNLALNTGKAVQFREEHLQESSEIMQSLENLNSEIREIWDVLNKQQHAANVTTVIPPVPLVYSDHVWPVATGNITLPTLNAIPTLADRLHEYHQRAAFATHGVQSIVVTQGTRAPQGAAVTTTLVERTKNLRDWLRQAKVEQGESTMPGQATL